MRAPRGFGDGKLVPFADSIWTATTPIRFVGTWFPHVMTVVRLSDGTLLLHSPCEPSAQLVEAVAALGRVAHIVAPNWFHDLFLKEYRALYPQAQFWGPPFLKAQHPSLIDNALNTQQAPWFEEMPYVTLRGLITFDESIFYHRASQTAIAADFLTNGSSNRQTPALTRLGYAFLGLKGNLQVFPVLRWFGMAQRSSMRQVARSLLAWQPNRLIVGHGTPITSAAFSQLQDALHWLVSADTP